MTRKTCFPMVALLLSSACAQFDALDGVASAKAIEGPYPNLVPTEQLIIDANSGTLTETTAQEMAARIAALKRRAALLRAKTI